MTKRVAIVTGAAGGMGQAFSKALVADGITVAGFDIATEGLRQVQTELGAAFLPVQVDLTDTSAISAAFDQVVAAFGGLDILVNNAGTCLMSDFPDIPADEFDRQMALNFSSAFHCCQAAVMTHCPSKARTVPIGKGPCRDLQIG